MAQQRLAPTPDFSASWEVRNKQGQVRDEVAVGIGGVGVSFAQEMLQINPGGGEGVEGQFNTRLVALIGDMEVSEDGGYLSGMRPLMGVMFLMI
jgi:hypothetical protein